TWCYHTVISVSATEAMLDKAADIFYGAAAMTKQPWYPQFQYGQTLALEKAGSQDSAQLSLVVVDLGLGKPRAYRQLASRHQGHGMRAIVLRSVNTGMIPWPASV